MTKDTWLPTGYEVPKSPSNYAKFEEGPNKFRILSKPIMGFEYWTKENKPVRSTEPFEEVPADAKLSDGQFKPKHFWAFVVWNYKDKKIQILELTQVSIQGPIQDLVENEDWGDPTGYDITITKKGEGLDTEYGVQPSPHKELSLEAGKAYRSVKIDLEALFRGQDPFSPIHDSVDTSEIEKNNPF